jgi:hypothetical protein
VLTDLGGTSAVTAVHLGDRPAQIPEFRQCLSYRFPANAALPQRKREIVTHSFVRRSIKVVFFDVYLHDSFGKDLDPVLRPTSADHISHVEMGRDVGAVELIDASSHRRRSKGTVRQTFLLNM